MKYLVTRPLEQSLELKERLEKEGNEVFCLPLIEIRAPEDGGAALRQALKQLSFYDWLLITSRNTVQALQPHITVWPRSLRVAASGPKTAVELKKIGCHAFFPEENFGSEGLVEFFKSQNISGKKFLYPRSSIGRKDWIQELEKMGAQVDCVDAYRTERTNVTAYDLFCLLGKGIEAVLFFSPSAVQHFFTLIHPNDPRIQKIAFVPVGPATTNVLQKR